VHQRLIGQTKVDIIGDVHGCYDGLICLLQRLGYQEIDGVFQHPERLIIFVGDLIDRGPQIREVLQLVQRMCSRGKALSILGNHEYNAVRFKEGIDALLRGEQDHGVPKRVQRLMEQTLKQFSNYPGEWRSYCDWFSQWPLFLEGEGFRVVHACWDSQLINEYRKIYLDDHLCPEFITASKEPNSFESKLVDRLTRGTSMPLPQGVKIKSKDGFIRHVFRTKFWAKSPETYGDVIFQPDPLPRDLHRQLIHDDHRSDIVDYPHEAIPVFFGHYWLKGRPEPLLDNVACLDYSAVNYGRLTAYQFDGEMVLSSDKFVWAYVDHST